MATAGPQSGLHSVGPRLPVGAQLGDYILGEPLWPLRIADAYRASGPKGPATVYVVHAPIAANGPVRDHIIAGTRAAAQLPEHKHLVRTLAAGLTGEILWIATEEIDGSLVRDMLSKKRSSSQGGLGARATGNLIAGVASALGEVTHGAIAAESVVVNRGGRVRVIDLALASGTIAAAITGLIPTQSSIAPEVLAGNAPNGASDVYGVGALLYEALVGQQLARGGPRPSEVVNGMSPQIDEVVARACHRDAAKRFGRTDVLGEVVGEALTKGGAIHTSAVPLLDQLPTLDQQQTSLATELASPAASGNSVVDRALNAALADSTEKWLVSKNKLDYGPFSLSDIVKQIEKGDIVAGNIIQDKDSGARSEVSEHPLLGPMVDAAKQRLDQQRRAAAEVRVQSKEKQRGVLLYAVIGIGVIAAAVVVYLIIKTATKSDDGPKVAAVTGLDGASLKVKVSEPKKPPPSHHSGGGNHGGGNTGGGNFKNTGENMALDMSDDGDDGSSTLDMGTVYGVYSRAGGQLGGCLQSSGAGQANIGIIINGPSGRVTWVKVNCQQTGGLYNCLSRVLRGLQFPSIKGTRTRAEFDIAL